MTKTLNNNNTANGKPFNPKGDYNQDHNAHVIARYLHLAESCEAYAGSFAWWADDDWMAHAEMEGALAEAARWRSLAEREKRGRYFAP